MRSLFIAALAVAAASPALAQSDFPETPMPQMSGPEMSGRPMGGQMRPPERENLAQMQARMTQMFNRLDANEDGVVDASELANARGGRMLARFDADADGRITREEFDVGLAAAFKAMDKNGDGGRAAAASPLKSDDGRLQRLAREMRLQIFDQQHQHALHPGGRGPCGVGCKNDIRHVGPAGWVCRLFDEDIQGRLTQCP